MSGLFDDQATKPGWTVPLGWTADNEGHCQRRRRSAKVTQP